MNIIRILLIAGLVYFALQQKQESTRNMILIVTGLLAVCMMSREGFDATITLTTSDADVTGMSAWGGASPQSGNTITSTDGSTVFTFALPAADGLVLDGPHTESISDKVTCTVDGQVGNASYNVDFATLPAVTTTSDITAYLDCTVDAAVPPPPTTSPCPSTPCPSTVCSPPPTCPACPGACTSLSPGADEDTDNCGDDWEWLWKDDSKVARTMCKKNSALWADVYCEQSSS